MKLSRLTLAITAVLGSSVSAAAFAIDLYVDTKTEQIYAKPGPGRVHMGSFVKEDAAKPAGNMTDRAGDKAAAKTGDTTADSATEKTDAAEVMALHRDIELKAKMREARLVSDMASLEERVKETEKTKM